MQLDSSWVQLSLKQLNQITFLGFNPGLFSFRLKGVKFTIGLYIPIVGIAKVYTVVDGKKERARLPWEFFHESLIKRLLATLGGVFAMLISGLLIYTGISFVKEEYKVSKHEINRYGINPTDFGMELGFHRGDRIVAVNGKDYEYFDELTDSDVLLNSESYYTVLRDSLEIVIKLDGVSSNILKSNEFFFSMIAPFEVSEVEEGSPAEKARILPGYRILDVNNHPIIDVFEMTEQFKADEDGIVEVTLQAGKQDSFKIRTEIIELTQDKRIGIRSKKILNYSVQRNTLTEAFVKGTHQAFRDLSIVVDLWSGDAVRLSPRKSLSGPIGIVSDFHLKFWMMIAWYAVWYSFWNLLPLPKSVFWEILAIGYETITKRKYPFSVFNTSLILSWIIVLMIMFWVFINDILRLF